jgi:hypothetical protein
VASPRSRQSDQEKTTRSNESGLISSLCVADGRTVDTCREVGVSASAGYEWLYRGWGAHPDRPPAPVYVAFARAVDAVFPGGFAERYEDEFVDVQSSGGTLVPLNRGIA